MTGSVHAETQQFTAHLIKMALVTGEDVQMAKDELQSLEERFTVAIQNAQTAKAKLSPMRIVNCHGNANFKKNMT